MNISLTNNDALSGVLKLEIEKSDYADLVDKNLHKLRQQANMPGFRKGMVPLGIVRKLYGKQVMAEEINKILAEKVTAYLRDNDVKILGDPLPNESEQKKIDFEVDENFDFYFDLAFSPDVDIELTKADELVWYQMLIEEEPVNQQVEAYRRNFGSFSKEDKVEADDRVKGILVELEDGTPKAEGIFIEDAVLMPRFMKGKMEQKKFLSAKLNGKFVFNPYKAYKGEEAELTSLLRIEKEKVKEMKSDFSFEIKEIERFTPAELNQELFTRVFGSDDIKDEAAFREKIKETLSEQLQTTCEIKFIQDVFAFLLAKAREVVFADDILKRWLLLTNKEMTQEQVEAEYPKVVEELKYQLIKDKLIKTHDIQVTKEDIDSLGRRIVKDQFARYGMLTVSDELLTPHVEDMMKNEKTVNSLINRVIEDKVALIAREQATVVTKEVTPEELARITKEKEQ